MELNEQHAASIMQAVSLVTAERERQVRAGLTPQRDLDLYHQCELSRAAASYVTPQGWRNHAGNGVPKMWPWHADTFKPGGQTYDGRMAELAKAGALILAEMERMMLRRAQSEQRRANSGG